jgi:hypothetical protein
MRRADALLRIAICGAIAGCSGGPSAPSGVPLLAEGRVSMTFTPQGQTFAAAAEAYRQLWVDEGTRIIEGMEQQSGLTFPENHVNAVVFEGVSRLIWTNTACSSCFSTTCGNACGPLARSNGLRASQRS